MPVGLIAIAVLLLVEAFFALRAGRITSAGICLGALAFAVVTLRNRYRRTRASTQAPADEVVAAQGTALVALVYPEQTSRLDALLAAVDPTCRNVLVLLLDPAATRAGLRGVDLEREPRIVGALARAVDRASLPVTVLWAAGPDTAALVVDTARRIGALRIVVVRNHEIDADDERRLAVAAWERLPSPRPHVRVDLVGDRPETSVTFELPAAPLHPDARA